MAIPKHVSTYILDAGLNYYHGLATRVLHVVKNYTLADSYATAVAASSGGGRSLGSVACTSPGGVQQGAGTAPKVPRYVTTVPSGTITVASGNTANGVSDDLGIVVVDTAASRILLSTDLTPDSSIDPGNILTVSNFTLTFNQPT